MSKRKSNNALQIEWARQQEIMAACDQRWMERWNSISSPFLRIQDWTSPQFTAERLAFIGPWLAARAALANSKSNTL